MTDFTKILPTGQKKIEADIERELDYSHNAWILDEAVWGSLTDEMIEDTLLRDFGLDLTPESKAMVMRCIDRALMYGS